MLECRHARKDRALQQVLSVGNVKRPPPAIAANASIYGGSCIAFTTELCRVMWPHKFRPELPSRYDVNSNPKKFLQLYDTCQTYL